MSETTTKKPRPSVDLLTNQLRRLEQHRETASTDFERAKWAIIRLDVEIADVKAGIESLSKS